MSNETMFETVERLEAEIEELKSDVENAIQRGDEYYDKWENTASELKELEEKLSQFSDLDDETLDVLKDYDIKDLIENQKRIDNGELIDANDDHARVIELVSDLQLSYERLNLGVLSEVDEIIKTTNKILEMYL